MLGYVTLGTNDLPRVLRRSTTRCWRRWVPSA
jgi:hypothetical protein